MPSIKVGDVVKFEYRNGGNTPRWDYGSDYGGSNAWGIGEVTSVSGDTVSVKYKKLNSDNYSNWNWPLSQMGKGKPGYLAKGNKIPKPRKKRQYVPRVKDVFFVETPMQIETDEGWLVPKGFVSRACLCPIADDFITMRLLDAMNNPDRGFEEALTVSRLDVDNIPKNSYHQRIKKNPKIW